MVTTITRVLMRCNFHVQYNLYLQLNDVVASKTTFHNYKAHAARIHRKYIIFCIVWRDNA